MKHYQNLMIGFGKANRFLAKQMSLRGESVAIIERDKKMYGGTCPNVGCLPSKSLILSGLAKRSWEDAIARKRKEREILRTAATSGAVNEGAVEIIDGSAYFLDEKTVAVGDEKFQADRIFINTGATPVIPDIPGVQSSNVITSEEALDLDELPHQFLIIGSGYVGLEFAGMYRNFGAEVTVLEMHDTFLPKEDKDVAAEILKDLEASGITVKLGVKIKNITETGVQTNDTFYPADKILIATGRKANIESLHLDAAGIETSHGVIKVDDKLKTTVKNIWALGDVRGGGQFYYLSTDDFRIIMNQLYADNTRTLSDRDGIIPYSVFITPPLSRIGLDEKQAKAAGISYRLFKFKVAGIVKTKIIEDNRGMMKALVDPETDELLGATLYAPESHETINLLALAMKMHTTYHVLASQIFTHPTFSEGLNDLFSESNEVITSK